MELFSFLLIHEIREWLWKRYLRWDYNMMRENQELLGLCKGFLVRLLSGGSSWEEREGFSVNNHAGTLFSAGQGEQPDSWVRNFSPFLYPHSVCSFFLVHIPYSEFHFSETLLSMHAPTSTLHHSLCLCAHSFVVLKIRTLHITPEHSTVSHRNAKLMLLFLTLHYITGDLHSWKHSKNLKQNGQYASSFSFTLNHQWHGWVWASLSKGN